MPTAEASAPTAAHLFPVCLAATFRPGLLDAARQVLEHLGLRVHIPARLTCCGQPAFNVGQWDEARRMARHTIRVLEAHPGPVVVPSGSCAAMLRVHYPALFADDPAWGPRAQALAARVYEFSEFIVEVLGITHVPGARWGGRLTYHPSCHMTRDLGVTQPPKVLLDHLPGARRVPLPDEEVCCGFGGAFSAQYPDLAAGIGEHKVEALQRTAAHVAVTADPGCLLHLAGMLHRAGVTLPLVHLAELLAAALEPDPAAPSSSP